MTTKVETIKHHKPQPRLNFMVSTWPTVGATHEIAARIQKALSDAGLKDVQVKLHLGSIPK